MRVVVADDSAVVRDGLLHALQAHGHDVVATAADGAELLACVERERPQVALIDIRMPPTHTSEGLDAASTIRKRAPDVAVLVLSQYVDADYALTLLRESPERSGYVLKDRVAELTTLLDAIERVARGETVVDPELVSCCCTVPRPRPGSQAQRARANRAGAPRGGPERPRDRRAPLAHARRPSRPTSATSSPSWHSRPTPTTTDACSPYSPSSEVRDDPEPPRSSGIPLTTAVGPAPNVAGDEKSTVPRRRLSPSALDRRRGCRLGVRLVDARGQ